MVRRAQALEIFVQGLVFTSKFQCEELEDFIEASEDEFGDGDLNVRLTRASRAEQARRIEENPENKDFDEDKDEEADMHRYEARMVRFVDSNELNPANSHIVEMPIEMSDLYRSMKCTFVNTFPYTTTSIG